MVDNGHANQRGERERECKGGVLKLLELDYWREAEEGDWADWRKGVALPLTLRIGGRAC